MYAVNMADWLAHKDDVGLAIILSPVVDRSWPLVTVEPNRVDGHGMALICDDERAEAIVHLVRRRYQRHQMRLYRSSTGRSWRRL